LTSTPWPSRPQPTIDAVHAPPGWYHHDAIDFSTDAPYTIVGVDPGRGTVFTFFQENTTHQDHVEAYRHLRQLWGDEYVLGPFGLSTTKYHHLIGTYRYNRLLWLEKKMPVPFPDMTRITFKVSSSERVRAVLASQALVQQRAFSLYGNRRLTKQKFLIDSGKKRFFHRLHFSLQQHFPSLPVVAFGSANVSSRSRSSPSTAKSSASAIVPQSKILSEMLRPKKRLLLDKHPSTVF